jgi:hypothetical protein
LVKEASFAAATGNQVQQYAITGLHRAAAVSGIADLATAPGKPVCKRLVADLVRCPSLGAQAKQPQTNPLTGNYESMAITFGSGIAGVSVISDDNFGATQITRVLNWWPTPAVASRLSDVDFTSQGVHIGH